MAITFPPCSCRATQQVPERLQSSGVFRIKLDEKYSDYSYRDHTISLIHQGYLRECIVGNLLTYPIDEYPVGNFVTCCNTTSLHTALPWFTQNRGQLSVSVHGLTSENLLDHTARAMWIGRPYPLDFTNTVVNNRHLLALRLLSDDNFN